MRSRSSRARTERIRRTRRGERGTSAVEFAIVTPLFLLLIFGIIEGGLYFHARNTAQSASREGVSYLRLAGNNSDPQAFVVGAERVAAGYASEIGRLTNVRAEGSIDETSGRVTVEVVGDVVLPVGGTIEVEQTSHATLEQFRGEIGREGDPEEEQ